MGKYFIYSEDRRMEDKDMAAKKRKRHKKN